jgi:hypothetical protein
MADDKLFGKYNDVVMMVFGFLLTGLVGTYISQVYTTKSAELAAANKIFADHNKLIGDRYFAMNQVMLVLAGNRKTPKRWKASQVEQRWELYRRELQNWNSTRSYNRELIRVYFGDELSNEERDIHYLLRAWGESMEHEQERPGSVDFDCLNRKVDEFLERSHQFSFKLAEAMRDGRIGSGRPTASVRENPRPDAPCLTDRSTETRKTAH